MDLKIFRDYDVRALAEEELTDEVVAQIGLAFGTYLKRQGSSSIVVGRDNRLSSNRIQTVLIDSLLRTGCDVTDIGETATPILCFALAYLDLDAGAMVTGSHNPPEFNGIKLQVGPRPLFGQALRQLGEIIEKASFQYGSGKLSVRDVIGEYLVRLKERIHVHRCLKVVVDCGNGNTSAIAPDLLSDLGLNVIPLYCESDGTFPHHHPDPAVPANLKDLCQEVLRTNADVGIAFDGDGNRIGVVDNLGRIVSPDLLLGLLARDEIARAGPIKVVCDVKTSQAVIEYIESHGGSVVMCKAGYPFVLEKMFEEGARLAGELPGHVCFNEDLFVFGDAIFVSCRLLELLTCSTNSLAEMLADFPQYFSTPEIRLPFPDQEKFRAVQQLRDHLRGLYPMIAIDGVRILFEGNGWALIRASNTEPALSLRFEAQTQGELEAIQSTVFQHLRSLGILT